MTRLLHLHNRYRSDVPSGETERVMQEAELLRGAGHAVSVRVIDNDRMDAWGPLRWASLPARTVWSGSSYRDAERAIARFRPHVVHVHNTLPLASPSVLWAARRSGAAVVHTLANYRLMCPSAGLFRDGRPCHDCRGRAVSWPGVLHGCYRGSRGASATVAAMLAAHRALGTWTRAVDVFLTASEHARAEHLRAGLPPDRVKVKPNTAPDPGPPEGPPGRHHVYAGRLEAGKGVDLLLRAWALAGPIGELRVLGDGPERASLEALVRERRIGGIRFLGLLPRGEVLAHLQGARSVVVPAPAPEVSSMSAIEGLAAGAPIVVSLGGAAAELAEPGRSGLTFRRGDTRSLADALRRLEDDDLASRLAAGARAGYLARHSPSAVVEGLERAYALAMALRRSG